MIGPSVWKFSSAADTWSESTPRSVMMPAVKMAGWFRKSIGAKKPLKASVPDVTRAQEIESTASAVLPGENEILMRESAERLKELPLAVGCQAAPMWSRIQMAFWEADMAN